MAARALAKAIGDKGKVYVSNVKPGISTTDQREEGFKDEMKDHPGHRGARDPVQRRRRQQGGGAGAGGVRPHARPRRRVRRQPVLGLGAANGVKQAGKAGKIKIVGLRRADIDRRQLKDGLFELAIAQHPAEIGYFGVMAAYAHLTGNSVPTAIGTGFTVMTKDNIDDPNVAQVHLQELVSAALDRARRRRPSQRRRLILR